MNREGIKKHKELFDAWLDGATVQRRCNGKFWDDNDPTFRPEHEYRIKPNEPAMSIIQDITRDSENGTPGPWSARKWDGDQWPEKRWSVGRNDNFGTCVCVSPRYADPSDLTDARRIANVPAMETAILEMHEALKWIADMEPNFAGQTPNEYHMQLKARAILAKLEGTGDAS